MAAASICRRLAVIPFGSRDSDPGWFQRNFFVSAKRRAEEERAVIQKAESAGVLDSLEVEYWTPLSSQRNEQLCCLYISECRVRRFDRTESHHQRSY
jgi:hypothetical protein